MGAYHTLDLELNRKFTLGKREWDSVALERIGEYQTHICTFFLRQGKISAMVSWPHTFENVKIKNCYFHLPFKVQRELRFISDFYDIWKKNIWPTLPEKIEDTIKLQYPYKPEI